VTGARAEGEQAGSTSGSAKAEEWSARYRNYLERSAARAARAQDLNREVIRRVAAQELAPWTLESRLSSFLAQNAISYSQQVARMTMAFLTGLVQTGSLYSYELMERVVPGAALPAEPAAPEFEPGNSGDWFRDLTNFAAKQNARVVAMLRVVMEKVASGELAPGEVEEASTKFHAERVPESTSRLVELYLDLLTGLEDTYATFSEDYLRAVLGALPRDDEGPDALEMLAPLGKATSVSVAVGNTDLAPASVRCELTDVRRSDGIGPAFEPIVSVSPDSLHLAPGEEATVQLTLHPDPDHFQAETMYQGVLRVASATRTLLEMPVRIRSAAPDVSSSPAEAPLAQERAPTDDDG